MNVRDTYRHHLSNLFFESPLDVSVHLFAVIGNGYYWDVDGNLSYDGKPQTKDKGPWTKRFGAWLWSWNPFRHTIRNMNRPYQSQLKNSRELEAMAKEIKRNFQIRYLEKMVDSGPVSSFFKDSYTRHGHYVAKGICVAYAKAFNFPDNIQKDWGETLLEFLQWWRTNLRLIYGVGQKGEVDFWEKLYPDIFKDYQEITKAYERLFFIINGETVEQQAEHVRKLLDELEQENLIPAKQE